VSDRSQKVRTSSSQRVADLMRASRERQRIWQPDELAAVLRHQLSAPVEFDLASMTPGERARLKTLAASRGLLVRSFKDLLHHPNPPIELLKMTKEFARANREHPDAFLPAEIATVLYFGSIAAAMTRCRECITELDEPALRKGFSWVLEQQWVDEPTRAVFQEALQFLGHGEVRPS